MTNPMVIFVLLLITLQTVISHNEAAVTILRDNTSDENSSEDSHHIVSELKSEDITTDHNQPLVRTTTEHIQPLVRFNSNGILKIVQFTDLHYGQWPDTIGPEDDLNSTRVMRDILKFENPDFVIFTGDLVTGDNMYPNVTEYIQMLLKPVVEKDYKWASVYGNHDTAPNVSRLEILRTEQAYGDLCYTKQVNPELPGVTNYFIPIYPPDNNLTTTLEEKPVMIWWFFDSQGGRTNAGVEPSYVDAKVVQWFKDENKRLASQWGQLPSLVFVHIPTLQYVDVQPTVSQNPLCSGLVDDRVTPQTRETGLMDALLEAGGVRTMFVGHEHGNSWCCFYREIEICYNRHTGYGGYGDWTRGSRVIKLDINNLANQTNYVRLETGEITDTFHR